MVTFVELLFAAIVTVDLVTIYKDYKNGRIK